MFFRTEKNPDAAIEMKYVAEISQEYGESSSCSRHLTKDDF